MKNHDDEPGFEAPRPAHVLIPVAQSALTPLRPAGRDRYLDTLRAVALARVVAFHSFSGAVWLSLVFPSMGVMFALAGSLMARSLDRPAVGVLKSRTRRLLLPLWAYAFIVLGLLFVAGWRPWQEEEGAWLHIALWFLPVGVPPYPENAGTNNFLADSTWGFQAEEILWYIRAYFWFMLLFAAAAQSVSTLSPFHPALSAPASCGAESGTRRTITRLGKQHCHRFCHLRFVLDPRFRPP